jgi:DNA polymerase III epsilon subunit-like protein
MSDNLAKEKYSRFSPGRYGILIDFETSGSDVTNKNHGIYQGISFGALMVDMANFEVVDSIYREIKFDETKYQWTKSAEEIHGFTREYLAENGISQEDALADLMGWIMKWIYVPEKLFVMGHNVPFDQIFIRQLFEIGGLDINFHHIHIDTSPIAYFLVQEYRSDVVFDLFAGTERDTHNALDDCWACYETLKTIKTIFMKGMNK